MPTNKTICEIREHQRGPTVSQFGRSRCQIICPFCATTCTAYIWSLSGGGKRCPGCRAMHTSWGTTIKDRPPG